MVSIFVPLISLFFSNVYSVINSIQCIFHLSFHLSKFDLNDFNILHVSSCHYEHLECTLMFYPANYNFCDRYLLASVD